MRVLVRQIWRFFFFAALAPSLPSAVRVRLGKCAMVRFFFAAFAAFSMFLRAARRCLEDAILVTSVLIGRKQPVASAPVPVRWQSFASRAFGH